MFSCCGYTLPFWTTSMARKSPEMETRGTQACTHIFRLMWGNCTNNVRYLFLWFGAREDEPRSNAAMENV